MNSRRTVAQVLVALSCCLSHLTPAQGVDSHRVKNVVLVHGAFADGSGWRVVSDTLMAHGYHVSIVQEPETSLADDAAATRRVIDAQDGPVVLVGHSWGGQVITETGDDPKVVSLVYLNALVPDVGESVDKLETAMPPDRNHIKTMPGGYLAIDRQAFPEDFAADVPAAQARFMAQSQVLIAAAALKEPAHAAPWKSKPTFALASGQDHIISPKLELWMYRRAKAKVTEVPTSSHAVYLSHPDVVVKLIEEAAAQ